MKGYYEKEVTHISGLNATVKPGHCKCATKRGITQIERARIIKRTLGVPVAARYMALRGWSLESALFTLAGV